MSADQRAEHRLPGGCLSAIQARHVRAVYADAGDTMLEALHDNPNAAVRAGRGASASSLGRAAGRAQIRAASQCARVSQRRARRMCPPCARFALHHPMCDHIILLGPVLLASSHFLSKRPAVRLAQAVARARSRRLQSARARGT